MYFFALFLSPILLSQLTAAFGAESHARPHKSTAAGTHGCACMFLFVLRTAFRAENGICRHGRAAFFAAAAVYRGAGNSSTERTAVGVVVGDKLFFNYKSVVYRVEIRQLLLGIAV